jgi:hypothetical protein
VLIDAKIIESTMDRTYSRDGETHTYGFGRWGSIQEDVFLEDVKGDGRLILV